MTNANSPKVLPPLLTDCSRAEQRRIPIDLPPVPIVGYFSIDEFCEWAGVGRTLAYKEMKANRLLYREIGRRRLISYDEAQRWVKERPPF